MSATEDLSQMDLEPAIEMQLDVEAMSRQGSNQSVRDAEFAQESGEDEDDDASEDFSPEAELRDKMAKFKTARIESNRIE